MHLLPLGLLLFSSVIGSIWFYPQTPPVVAAARFPAPVEVGQNLLWFWSRLLTTAHWVALPLFQHQQWELILGSLVVAGIALLAWKSHDPLRAWAVWVCTATVPFLTLSPSFVQDMHQGGPSRQLYLASAGSSVLLAWVLLRGGAWVTGLAGQLWGRAVCMASASALLASSLISLRETEAFSYYSAGRSYLAVRAPGLGISCLERAVQGEPQIVPLDDAYKRLCLELLGKEEGETALANALQAFPNSLVLNIYESVAASTNPDIAIRRQAQDMISSTRDQIQVSLLPDFELTLSFSYYNLGLNSCSRGDFRRAIDAFRYSLQYQHPDRVRVLNNLVSALYSSGNRCLQQGDTARARLLWNEASGSAWELLRIQPDPRLFFALGENLQAVGQLEEAIDAYHQALEKDESFVAAQFRLGMAHLQKGDVAAARAVYAEGIRKFGAAEGERTGAVADLSNLVAQGLQAAEARDLLSTYWPESK